MSVQLTSFCWTDFEVMNAVRFIQGMPNNVKYMCWGLETCPETGKQHLQGYAELHKKQTISGIQKAWKNKMHIEKRMGTQAQAIEYCKKEGKFTEMGEKGRQGERKDLVDVRVAAAAGGMRKVTQEQYNFQAIRVAEKFLTYNEKKRDWKPDVIWYWGESGAGKSREARSILSGIDYYCKNEATKWWDGYDAHEAVIIDDFRDSWWGITEMLSLLDRYERQVECKGGNRQMLAKYIVITSIDHPSACYQFAKGEPKIQLLRRLDEVIEIKK